MIGSAVFKMSQFACLYIREEKNTGLLGNFKKRGKVISGPFYIILYFLFLWQRQRETEQHICMYVCVVLMSRERGKGLLPASTLATQPPQIARGSGTTLSGNTTSRPPPPRASGKVTPPPPGPRGDRPQTGETPNVRSMHLRAPECQISQHADGLGQI